MTESVLLKQIHDDLLALRKEVEIIKEKVVDVDMLLSTEDKEDLAQARREFKARKTKSLEQLEKELR